MKYLGFVLLVFGFAFAQDITATYGNFEYVQRLDPIDDTDNSLIAVKDDKDSFRPSIIFWRCSGPELEIYFVAGDYLGTDGSSPATYRFGELEAVTEVWNASTDGEALFVPRNNVANFSTLASQNTKLAIRVSDYENTPQTYVFDLTGFTDAVRVLGCNPGI
jgi:hypothetical protein